MVNLIGLSNFISTVIGPNLTSCHGKLILLTPLGSKTRKLGAFGSYIPTSDVTKTRNGEWGMGNGEWGMGNGEWGMGNGEWGMGNGEWGMGNGASVLW